MRKAGRLAGVSEKEKVSEYGESLRVDERERRMKTSPLRKREKVLNTANLSK
jgi:hypothetical protein